MIFSALILIAGVLTAEARSPYIIGGVVSSKGRWPHQVSLQMTRQGSPYQHGCGGSILNEKWILVAAHCVMYSKKVEDYKVRLGMFQLSLADYEQELGIAEIIEHPKWDMYTPGMPYDMCLLKVDGTIDLSNKYVSAIPMGVPSETYAGNKDCWISGWGRDDRNSKLPSDMLKEYNIPVITTEYCMKLYGWFGRIHPLGIEHICMGGPETPDIHACHGDSGGPMVCKRNGQYELVGVASRTGSPQCSKRPSVYMRVSTFRSWIEETISN